MNSTQVNTQKVKESQTDYMELINRGRLLHDHTIAFALKSMFTIFDSNVDEHRDSSAKINRTQSVKHYV